MDHIGRPAGHSSQWAQWVPTVRQGRVGAVLGLVAGPGATLLMTVWEDQMQALSN